MKKIYLAMFLLSVSIFVIYIFQDYYPDFIFIFANVCPIVISGFAVFMASFSLERYWRNSKSPFANIWLYLICGIFLWFLGETSWGVYTLLFGVELPYPSVADIFWIGGYIPLFIGFFMYVIIFRRALTWKMIAKSLVISATITILVIVTVLLPILTCGEDLVTLILDFAYPLLDVMLFSISLVGLTIFWGGRLKTPWLLITAAMLTNICADAAFSYATAQGIYYPGHLLDAFYNVAYLLIYAAFIMAINVHIKEF
jgi:hypothetical protein